MELIVRHPRHHHVSQDAVEELESAILSDPRVASAKMNGPVAAAITGAVRLLGKAGANSGRFSRAARRASTSAEPSRDYFAVMMDLDASRVAPWFVRSARKSVYIFDAWPAKHEDIRRLVESWGIQYAFVSSSQAAQRLSTITEHCTFIWVPEGIDPSRYHWRSFIERDIDVLQLGRRYDAHHALIAPALEKAGKSYLYEKQKGSIVFPRRQDFIAGLARSRISICVPSNVTHPERAGDIETMTSRFLQSMASKCLVLGRAPAEMIELFGYNPVVEIEMGAAAGQILDILATYNDYLPLIERNFSVVTTEHTWARRWERMASVLFRAPQRARPAG